MKAIEKFKSIIGRLYLRGYNQKGGRNMAKQR